MFLDKFNESLNFTITKLPLRGSKQYGNIMKLTLFILAFILYMFNTVMWDLILPLFN